MSGLLNILIGPITSLLDKFIPDKDQRDKLAHEIAVMAERNAFEIAKEQIRTNQAEAAHKSLFVAGWRPATGWCCTFGLGFNYILVPLLNAGLVLLEKEAAVPALDLSVMMPVLLGMLGLAGARSWEKSKGVAREG